MNDENLKKNEQRTPTERRELASRAGKASGAARRQKADLRRFAQTFIDGTYTLSDGSTITAEDILRKGFLKNLASPQSRNWVSTVRLLADLTDAGQSQTERAQQRAETEYLKARTKALKSQIEIPEIADDGFIEALNDTAVADWDDNN